MAFAYGLGAADFSVTVYGKPDDAMCDPFWSEQNGACSDYLGNYVTPSGQSVGPDQAAQLFRQLAGNSAVSDTGKKVTDWFAKQSPWLWGAMAFAAASVVLGSGGRRR
jgi:hypothetical protein